MDWTGITNSQFPGMGLSGYAFEIAETGKRKKEGVHSGFHDFWSQVIFRGFPLLDAGNSGK